MSKSNLIYASLRYGFCFGNELLVCEFATSYVLRLGKLRFFWQRTSLSSLRFAGKFWLKS
ncbi:hypothetical protein CINF_1685 [Candidatus Campylobacter infans]|uniref:Uncharacterized protein n=1 Tax=Candidatus Campylobacter infans TaxID=2561898 RepID=A0A7H9CLS3_9BACT|nr:hypothetical protein CINF_1685 [Candidatus Campylobacter infans]